MNYLLWLEEYLRLLLVTKQMWDIILIMWKQVIPLVVGHHVGLVVPIEQNIMGSHGGQDHSGQEAALQINIRQTAGSVLNTT